MCLLPAFSSWQLSVLGSENTFQLQNSPEGRHLAQLCMFSFLCSQHWAGNPARKQTVSKCSLLINILIAHQSLQLVAASPLYLQLSADVRVSVGSVKAPEPEAGSVSEPTDSTDLVQTEPCCYTLHSAGMSGDSDARSALNSSSLCCCCWPIFEICWSAATTRPGCSLPGEMMRVCVCVCRQSCTVHTVCSSAFGSVSVITDTAQPSLKLQQVCVILCMLKQGSRLQTPVSSKTEIVHVRLCQHLSIISLFLYCVTCCDM